MLKENYEEVQKKITEACKRAGRNREEVTLIAVSKTKPVEMMREAMQCGIVTFGENKVQEIVRKYDAVKPVRWHLIGHLQSNKVKYIIDKVYMIHSVDSVHLMDEIERQAEKHNVCMKILIQVNISGEKTKFGIRKLTPIECFYAQGYPKYYELPTDMSDARLYKQAGNSVVVPVINRIAENIMKALK